MRIIALSLTTVAALLSVFALGGFRLSVFRSADDHRLINDYIEYKQQGWAGILTGLEQDDFTAWNESERFMGCDGGQSEPPLEVARQQAAWWQGLSPYELAIREDYGVYNGYRVVGIGNASGMEFLVVGITEVAGYQLAHNCCRQLMVHGNGEFRDIRDAYELGLLSQSDISQLYRTHFADCNFSRARGTWESFHADEGFRELRWELTPDGNRLSVTYNVRDFAHLGLSEEQVQADVLRLADVVAERVMSSSEPPDSPQSDVISVDSVWIERWCIFDEIAPVGANSFFVTPGLQRESGTRSSGERFTVHREEDGEWWISVPE
jgi:hypothetical protein